MSKYRYIQFIKAANAMVKKGRFFWIVLMMGLFAFNVALSQTNESLTKLYQNNRIAELGDLNKQNKIQSPGWKMFVDAIFENDADAASRTMLSAYSLSNDPALQKFIKERISKFYSARGYYETSRRILEDEIFFQKIISINGNQQIKNKNDSGEKAVQPIDEKGNQFGVQVGAFSTVQNAQNVSRKYQKYYLDSKVMKKVRNGNSLYIVVIGGYSSRKEAEKAIPAINNKLNVKGYIIQY